MLDAQVAYGFFFQFLYVMYFIRRAKEVCLGTLQLFGNLSFLNSLCDFELLVVENLISWLNAVEIAVQGVFRL